MLIIMGRHKSFILNSKISGKLLVWRVYISKELPKFGFTSTLKKKFTKAKQLPKYTTKNDTKNRSAHFYTNGKHLLKKKI